jgi:hypothetical protein
MLLLVAEWLRKVGWVEAVAETHLNQKSVYLMGFALFYQSYEFRFLE